MSDCRYALQAWAAVPGSKPITLVNAKANRNCASLGRAQIAQAVEKKRSIPGATAITQRIKCIGKGRQNWCSAKSANYIRTLRAVVVLKDVQAPAVQILGDTPLAGGAWVRGDQPLNYTASDNIGVELRPSLVGGARKRRSYEAVSRHFPGRRFHRACSHVRMALARSTSERISLAEGTQQLVVQAEDAASNTASSEALVARIDNTAPARVDVALEGGDQWRNQNAWTAVWANPDEGDRAPIVAADYKLCDAQDATSCSHDTQAAPGISRLPMTVPGPGEWKLSVWRTDAAGNQNEAHRSVPVTLRYDPEPPKLAFESPDPADPTLVAAHATDELSGVAGGVIDIAPAGTGAWQPLTTGHDDGRLVARIDDATLPPGAYVLRAHASDRAGNETTQDRRGDGQPMMVTLPLRKPASLQAGFERTVRRPGTRRGTIVVLRPAARVGYEQRAAIAGRLTTDDGRAIAGAAVQLFAAEQVIDTVTTDANGRFRTSVVGTQSQDLRLAYTGSSQALPTQTTLKLRVPAATSAKVSRQSRPERASGHVPRKGARPAGARRRQARRDPGPVHRPLADVPHDAQRRAGALVEPLPLPAHPGSPALPVPSPAPEGGRLSLRDERVADARGAGVGHVIATDDANLVGPMRGDRVLDQLRQRLTYANVMATVAVFIALGGSSYAALQIDSGDIANNSVRSVDVRNRTLSDRDVKRNGLTGRSIRESRLGRVPQAREADRLGGMTAADLLLKCPEGTFVIADVCVETTPRSAVPYGAAVIECATTEPARSPGRRLPTHGELRAALSGVQLAPGGELTAEVYPSSTRPGDVDVLVVTDQVGSVTLTANKAAGQGVPLRHRPQELTRCEITPTRKECDVIAECSPTAAGGPFRAAVPPELSCLPSRSAGRLARGRRDRVAADAGGDRGRPARVLGYRCPGGRGGRGP